MDISRRELFVAAGLTGLAALVLTGIPSTANAVEKDKNGYNSLIPNLDGYRPLEPVFTPAPGVPGKKMKIQTYESMDGNFVSKFSVDDYIFGIGINLKGGSNFSLRDSDGDGIFREKYAPREFMHIPTWVIKKIAEPKI